MVGSIIIKPRFGGVSFIIKTECRRGIGFAAAAAAVAAV